MIVRTLATCAHICSHFALSSFFVKMVPSFHLYHDLLWHEFIFNMAITTIRYGSKYEIMKRHSTTWISI